MINRNFLKTCLGNIFLFGCLCSPIFLKAHAFEHPATWRQQKACEMLLQGRVVSKFPMRNWLSQKGKKADFEGRVFVITLDNGLEAVFKCSEDAKDNDAEKAAYEASVFLGFPYIPPTVIRSIDDEKGSLQLLVKTPIDALEPDAYRRCIRQVGQEKIANLKLFYFVFGQWDSGAHNLLFFDDGSTLYPVAIDNSGIGNLQYVRYGELPFVRTCYAEALNTNDWDQAFPFDNAKVIENPTPENLKKLLGDHFPETFYRSFKPHEKPLKYVIYQNAFWRQFHAFEEGFVRSFTEECPPSTLAALQKLDKDALKQIYGSSQNPELLSDRYLNAILERRNEALKHLQSVGQQAGSLVGPVGFEPTTKGL